MTKYLLSILAALLVAGPALAVEYTSQGVVVLRTSAVHTTDLTVEFVNDGGYCGAFIYEDATVDDASAIVSTILQIVEIDSGKALLLSQFGSVTLNAVEDLILQIGARGKTETAAIDDVVETTLPYRFNIFLDHTDADPITYSASINFTKHCNTGI